MCYIINITYNYRPLILDKNNLTRGNLNDIQDDAQYLIRLYFVAFRDYVFYQLFNEKKTIDVKNFVRRVIDHYFKSEIKILTAAEKKKFDLYNDILIHLNLHIHLFIADSLTMVGNSEDFQSIGPIRLSKKTKLVSNQSVFGNKQSLINLLAKIKNKINRIIKC